jgi:hypothetical protein
LQLTSHALFDALCAVDTTNLKISLVQFTQYLKVRLLYIVRATQPLRYCMMSACTCRNCSLPPLCDEATAGMPSRLCLNVETGGGG